MEDRLYPGIQPTTETPPLRFPGRPFAQADGAAGFARDVDEHISIPYSRSSPGDLYAPHMEHRSREVNASESKFNQSNQIKILCAAENGKRSFTNREQDTSGRDLLKPLEDCIVTAFSSFDCINTSFSTVRPKLPPRAASEGISRRTFPIRGADRHARTDDTQLSEMDAKTLLLGDVAENGLWWTGARSDLKSPERSRTYRGGAESYQDSTDIVTLKSPRIDWAEVNEWYHLALYAGQSWTKKLEDLVTSELHESRLRRPSHQELDEIGEKIMEAQFHAQRVLLKATESLLKRPGRPLNDPNDLRFLLIILANPLLYPGHSSPRAGRSRSRSKSRDRRAALRSESLEAKRRNTQSASRGASTSRGSSGQHSSIIKRILGLLSNVSNECHHHLVSWFARYSDGQFQRTTDLIGSFVTYRLTRQHGKKREVDPDIMAGLIPSMSTSGRGSSAASLHAALGASGQSTKKTGKTPQPVIYNDDWQIKAAARVMALLFSANNSGLTRRRGDLRPSAALEGGHSAGLAAREKAQSHGQILPTSGFYNTLLDYSDLIADFEAWEGRRGKFAFCQYPFFLSIWAKIQIMEHDARRQMEVKAREAFFDSIMTRKTVNQYLVLKVRRDCLVEDSLKGVGEVVGTGDEEIKKGLRIEFKGEEGIDAGGLRKEWFLLLVRDVFNPEHGKLTLTCRLGILIIKQECLPTMKTHGSATLIRIALRRRTNSSLLGWSSV